MYWDYTYILVLIGALIAAAASGGVRSAFRKYSGVSNRRGLTAEQAALEILHSAGIYDVRVDRIRGHLTDHYSPHEKVLRLSDSVYGRTSIAALGVAAHEAGHAIQHKEGYFPLKLRSMSVPLANFGSMLSWPIIMIGLIFGQHSIARLGVVFFLFVVFFQLITLPVELDASHRALSVLEEHRFLDDTELTGARKVLTAAAMTYVAALFNAVLQLLRLLILTRRRDD